MIEVADKFATHYPPIVLFCLVSFSNGLLEQSGQMFIFRFFVLH